MPRLWSRTTDITAAGRYPAAENFAFFQGRVLVRGRARRSKTAPQEQIRCVVAKVCRAHSVLDSAGAWHDLHEQITAELADEVKVKTLEISLVPEEPSVSYARSLEAVLRRREQLDQIQNEIFAHPARTALWFVDGNPERMRALSEMTDFDEARERLTGTLGTGERQAIFEIIDCARKTDPRLWAHALSNLAQALRELGAEETAAALEREAPPLAGD